MKKLCLIIGLIIATLYYGNSQKIFTRSAKICFYSDAPLEKIEAQNTKATSIIDLELGRMEFAVLIKAFHFEKALMQEHFNENYMESSKFPKATFKGKIENFADYNFSVDGEYNVQVSGELTIHGQSKTLITSGKIIVENGIISSESTFEVEVADFKIEIPALVKDNIAKTVEIRVECTYEPLSK